MIAADVCVIGGGPAGVTISDGLVRAGASVALVESGGWHEEPAADELDHGCLPLGGIDLEQRPWVAHGGWSLSAAELAPYETQAAATLGFEAFVAPQSDGALVDRRYHFPADPQVFRAMFLRLLTEPRFRAELETTAVELEVIGDRLTSVRCRRLRGGELRVSADTIVLAGRWHRECPPASAQPRRCAGLPRDDGSMLHGAPPRPRRHGAGGRR